VNRDEAEKLLRRYRPGTSDAEDPPIAEALLLAGSDPELGRWLAQQAAQQDRVRQQFRKITAPAGLHAQIISQHRARRNIRFWRRPSILLAAAAALAVLIGLPFWFRTHPPVSPGFAVYQRQMAALALRGYGMDVITNDPVQIRAYLAQNQAPANFRLPVALQQAALAGCAIENWQGAKISMLCFRTGRPLPNGAQSDLWLFVIDEATLRGAPAGPSPQFAKINRLTAAVWHQDGKLYLLATTADEPTLRRFL
jgi:uncharacterized membrane protein YbaN (DUF454 family)